jgi:hypothetical protein
MFWGLLGSSPTANESRAERGIKTESFILGISYVDNLSEERSSA